MKFYNYIAIGALLGLIGSSQAIKLVAHNRDEVDDLMEKQDQKDEIGGQCCEHHTHEVLNRNGGYLCKVHYQKAQENDGKCDQCCWWEVT